MATIQRRRLILSSASPAPVNPIISANPVLNLDADNVLLNGSRVVSNPENTVFQPTASLQPLLVTNAINGHNLIRFEGSRGLNTNLEYLSRTNTVATVFIVCSKTNNTDTGYLLHSEGTISSQSFFGFGLLVNLSGENRFICGGTIIPYTQSTTPILITLRIDRPSNFMSLSINNGSELTDTPGSSANNEILTIGYRTPSSPAVFLRGDIPALAVFNRLTTTEETNNIKQFLINKYAL
jgi:hypothetical protein